jgi:hypothetical protein
MGISQVKQYVYDPPAGSPPLEFMYDGGPLYVMPSDQYWKRAEEERVIGVKLDIHGNVAFEKKRTRTIWVPDEEKTAAALVAGHRIDNTIWLTTNQYRTAMTNKYAPLNRHLRAVKDLESSYRKTTAQREADFQAELENINKMHELQKREIQDQAAREIQEMRAEFSKMVKSVATEVGTDVKMIEQTLKELRKSKGQAVVANREGRRESREIIENAQNTQ